MASDTINLRQARKRALRTNRAAEAAENRAKHGMSKAERKLRDAEAEKLRRLVDRAKRADDTEKKL